VSSTPRAVLVTRETDYERLIATHATRGQAEFFLKARGQDIAVMARMHGKIHDAITQTRKALPEDWRTANVKRHELDRFIFAQGDYVFAIGQDGLVANLAKYLDGQLVFGINPDPDVYEGALTQLETRNIARAVVLATKGHAAIEHRTMLQAQLDDGPHLLALNEVFVGHRSHQSARYEISLRGESEYQSSSGVIIATGTGATGWAKSIMTATNNPADILPEDQLALYFAREPWPSKSTGCQMTFGVLQQEDTVTILSNMNDGGVVFADGIEEDRLEFSWGRRLEVSIAEKTLNLVAR
jgi:NAD kinase